MSVDRNNVIVNIKRKECSPILEGAINEYLAAESDKAKAFCEHIAYEEQKYRGEYIAQRKVIDKEQEWRKREQRKAESLKEELEETKNKLPELKKKVNLLEERNTTLSTLLNKTNLALQRVTAEQ